MSSTTEGAAPLELPGSQHAAPAGARLVGPAPRDQQVAVSIYLKPRDAHQTTETALTGSVQERREHLARHRRTAHRDDIHRIETFATDHGLTVLEADPSRRLVRIGGTAAKMEAAFGTSLSTYEQDGSTFRGRTGGVMLPRHLHGIVESVLGLDERPVAQARIVRPRAAQPQSILPNQISALYDFPTGVDGSGVTIALIELGGGFKPTDTEQAFKAMGLKPPKVVAVAVDGAKNDASGSDADGEVALDIQVAGGVAPGTEIAVYFTPNTNAGFADAISQAAHDTTNKPSVISISWGGPESTWDRQSVTTMNSVLREAAALGISVYVASGDSLATDGVSDGRAHVDFPASSVYATGCGGTHITDKGSKITREVVWNDGDSGTGGGISDLFDVPAFQSGVTLPPSVNAGRKGRGVPDVAGDAAPASGYSIVVDGQAEVVGGTSGVAPLWAGLTALINQKAANPVGFLPTWLYANIGANPELTMQITSGDNKPTGSELGYNAGAGWNACTGLGRPNGQALFDALTGGAKA
nr:S53 family peptidase [uncultured Lichenicoccus sp.]